MRCPQYVWAAREPGFDVVDEFGACGLRELEVWRRSERVPVSAGRHGRGGTYYADMTVACGVHSAAYCRMYYFDHGNLVSLPRISEYGGACAIACDDQHLDALVDQVVHDVQRERTHFGDGPRTIRPACGVADVEDGFVWQQIEH